MKCADIIQGYSLAAWLGLFCPSFTPADLLLVQWASLALLDEALKVFAGTAVHRNIEEYIYPLRFYICSGKYLGWNGFLHSAKAKKGCLEMDLRPTVKRSRHQVFTMTSGTRQFRITSV